LKKSGKMETLRRFLRAQAQKYGKPVLMLYALLLLLATTGLLGLVYLLFGWLMLQSPNGVLALSVVLVALIFYFQYRKKP
jgi:hypothetical protein